MALYAGKPGSGMSISSPACRSEWTQVMKGGSFCHIVISYDRTLLHVIMPWPVKPLPPPPLCLFRIENFSAAGNIQGGAQMARAPGAGLEQALAGEEERGLGAGADHDLLGKHRPLLVQHDTCHSALALAGIGCHSTLSLTAIGCHWLPFLRDFHSNIAVIAVRFC